jgi:hypothetical protein
MLLDFTEQAALLAVEEVQAGFDRSIAVQLQRRSVPLHKAGDGLLAACQRRRDQLALRKGHCRSSCQAPPARPPIVDLRDPGHHVVNSL